MSHNSYEIRLTQLRHGYSEKELSLRGERHFSMEDMESKEREVSRRYEKHQLAFFFVGFVLGMMFAAVILHHHNL